jgi:flagellin
VSIQFHSILKSIYNYNQLQKTTDILNRQLTTGKRINSPADNPFLFNRITRFQTELSQFETYFNHINEGISVMSIVTDATSQQLTALQKMLDLADKARQSGISQNTRNSYDAEYQKLYQEIDAIVDKTTYNSQKLLDGTYATTGMTLPTGQDQTFELIIKKTTTASNGLDLVTDGTSIATISDADKAFTAVQDAITTLTNIQSGFGTDQFILESRSSLMESKQTELESLISKYQGVDLVKVSAQLEQNQIIQQYSLAAISSMLHSQQSMIDYLFPRL